MPENLVSRDGFGSPVPRQPAHLHTHAAYLQDSSRVPRRRPFIYLKPPYAIGSVPTLSGFFPLKKKMPIEWRTIKSLGHKIQLHGRREKWLNPSREKNQDTHHKRKVDEKSCVTFSSSCVTPAAMVRPTNLMSRMNGKKTHTQQYLP